MRSDKTVNPPTSPERGPCEYPIRRKETMPTEAPIRVPTEPDRIAVPNWPAPVKEPASR